MKYTQTMEKRMRLLIWTDVENYLSTCTVRYWPGKRKCIFYNIHIIFYFSVLARHDDIFFVLSNYNNWYRSVEVPHKRDNFVGQIRNELNKLKFKIVW